MIQDEREIFLIDVSSLFFRAFYAIGPLTSPSGLPTNAVYGFLTMVTKLLKEENPRYVVFCYDRPEPSFRREIYQDYKAHRRETPEELVPQIPYIKKIADLFGIPSVEAPRYEADDLIGSLALLARKHDLEVYIVSGDKDFAQLVGPHVWLLDTMKNVKYGPGEVFKKWGVRPDQIVDYLSLVGDSSDNIPGVRGIGSKGAQSLLAKFDSLKRIYESLDQITGGMHEKLQSGKREAFLSQELAKIQTQAPIPQDLAFYERKPFQRKEIQQFFVELNFRNLEKILDQLSFSPEDQPPPPETSSGSDSSVIEIHPSKDKLSKFLHKGQELWAFQGGLEEKEPSSSLYLADEKTSKVYLLQGEVSDWRNQIQELSIQWVGYDLKSLWHSMGIFDFSSFDSSSPLPQGIWDSLLAAYALGAGESLTFGNLVSSSLEETLELPSSPHKLFSLHLRLKKVLEEKLNQKELQRKVYTDIELPLLPILYRMECLGVRIDSELLSQQSEELRREIAAIEEKIYDRAGESFNVASPKQLGRILFEKLNLPPSKKNKTGFSTDNDVLETLRFKDEIIPFVLEFRELSKLKSTYVDPLPQMVKKDGRIHTTMNQALTATGRLSSTDPNLQNIPIRTERGARIRRAFIPDDGKKLLSADYSQIELRILAHYSGDKNLCEAFRQDRDIHAATAAEVFGVSLERVTTEMRRMAKAVNFGIAYGQGAFGLAGTLGISRFESSEIIKKYFSRFPDVRVYIEETVAQATKDGFVETLFGRKRYIKELYSKSAAIKKFGERAAINTPIQGTAADIVKLAMIKVSQQVPLSMILQVHDELIFEGTEEELRQATDQIIYCMTSVVELKIPLQVNVSVGANWDEAH